MRHLKKRRVVSAKHVTLIMLALVPIVACREQDQSGVEWLHPPPAVAESEWTPLPLADVHEVATAKQTLATEKLVGASFLPLDQGETDFFSGYRGAPLGPGKRAFLVRTVFGHQGTGAYTVLRRGDDVFVRHGSLGRSSPHHKGALVLILDFTPREIYVATWVAE